MSAAYGAAGGVMGFVISEALVGVNYSPGSDQELRMRTGIWFALVVLGIGLAIIGGHSLTSRTIPAAETVIIGLVALLGGGFVAGYLAQFVFEAMVSDSGNRDFFNLRVPRAIGWAIAAGIGGVAVGLALRSIKRVQNGLLGGAAGGLLGGLLFDSLGVDSVARAVGITIVGTLMGLLIGLIDAARTAAWIKVVSGELRGREFPLLDDVVSLGRARSNRVCLAGDSLIAERHLEIRRSGAETTFQSAVGSVILNGTPTTAGRLKHGDSLTIGRTEVIVEFRAHRQDSMALHLTASHALPPRTVGSVDQGPTQSPAKPQSAGRRPNHEPRPVIPVNRPD